MIYEIAHLIKNNKGNNKTKRKDIYAYIYIYTG